MIKFIIYEDDLNNLDNYINIINKYMLNKNITYKILVFNKFEKNLYDILKNTNNEKRIYLLDIEVPGMSGIDLAREIRNNGDWQSQIIIITGYNIRNYYLLTNRILVLTFILKNKLKTELNLSLDTIWKIFFTERVLSFRYNGEIFNIFYNDINYIEKNLYDNSATIFTKNDIYVIRSSINMLMKKLEIDKRFFKSHRSCIINLDNVCCYDINRNVVKFKNNEINLVSRNKKKELEILLLNRCNKDDYRIS